jgi:hypothetical protein
MRQISFSGDISFRFAALDMRTLMGILVRRELGVQECDAVGADSSAGAGCIKILLYIKLILTGDKCFYIFKIWYYFLTFAPQNRALNY